MFFHKTVCSCVPLHCIGWEKYFFLVTQRYVRVCVSWQRRDLDDDTRRKTKNDILKLVFLWRIRNVWRTMPASSEPETNERDNWFLMIENCEDWNKMKNFVSIRNSICQCSLTICLVQIPRCKYRTSIACIWYFCEWYFSKRVRFRTANQLCNVCGMFDSKFLSDVLFATTSHNGADITIWFKHTSTSTWVRCVVSVVFNAGEKYVNIRCECDKRQIPFAVLHTKMHSTMAAVKRFNVFLCSANA